MTEEMENKMIALWEKGVPASQIAVRLGITRNAVAGKLHRLKFSGRIGQKNIDGRLDSIKGNIQQLEKERQTIAALQSAPKHSVYKIEDKLISLPKVNTDNAGNPVSLIVCAEASAPVGKPLRFDLLTAKSCRFVINSGPAKDFLFCGKEKTRRSYCEEHFKLCHYIPVRIKKDEGKAQSS